MSAAVQDPLRRLLAAAADMNEHELAALAFLAERFAAGAKQYGHFDPETDPRRMDREMAEEDADGLVYLALGHVQRVVRSGTKETT